jgi:hypothetical protein
MRQYITTETARGEKQWESRSRPLVADDPSRLRDVGMDVKLGQDFYLDEGIPHHESEEGFVSVTERSFMWRHAGSTIFIFQVLTTNESGGRGWTIMSRTYNHLASSSPQAMAWNGSSLGVFRPPRVGVAGEVGIARIKLTDVEATKRPKGITCLQEESTITAPPFLSSAGRR